MPEQNFDDEDVKAALKRETADGSGFDTEDELPESDFESFAEQGVENDGGYTDFEGDVVEDVGGRQVSATIAYDKPVKNLIDQLSATGHVTHTAYQKKSVTLHHNGARLSHEGVLNLWKTRPASAHFDVDSAGAVAQYVKVNEYAWAVRNLKGNQETISIEMANATLAPGWTVADATWKGAARLAGWLFSKVIGERPSKSNFFYHHHWSSTVCAGPYMDKIYDKVLKAAQDAYDSFKSADKPTPSSPRPTIPAKKSIT